MTVFRRCLRSWAMVWMVLQSTSLAALVSRDCCAAHEQVATDDCHATPDAGHCAKPVGAAAAEAPCPMHADGRGGDARTPRQTPDCVLRGTCDGPPLFTLFVGTGVLPDPAGVTVPPPSRAVASDLRQEPLARIQPPLSPPPRA